MAIEGKKLYLGNEPITLIQNNGFVEVDPTFVPQVDYLFDLYPGAVAGYSLRKLTTAWTGSAIEVTRTSDSATQDIGFDSNGDLDTSALTTFIGGNTGVVSKWYDQTGNGEHMEQTTQANMATIVSSGTLITRNGKPAVRFDGSNDSYVSAQSTNPFSFTGGVSIVYNVHKNATAYKQYESIIGAGATGAGATNQAKMLGVNFGNSGNYSPRPTIATDIWRPSGVQYDGTVSTDTTMTIGFYISNWSTHRSTGFSNLRLNGTDLTTKTYNTFDPDGLNTNAMRLGVFDTTLASSFFGGDVQEVLVWASDENSNRVGIESNITDYFIEYDTDAAAFISASGITDLTEKLAINQLVNDLKNAGLWSKFVAFWPFVGGTASTHKWNLVDPRDLDAAFRLTFNGTLTHSSTGVKGDGSTGYYNTHIDMSSDLSQNSNTGFVYTRVSAQEGKVSGYGAYPSGNDTWWQIGSVRNPSDNYLLRNFSTNAGSMAVANTNGAGMFSNTRTSSSSVTASINKAHTVFSSNTSVAANSGQEVIGLAFYTTGPVAASANEHAAGGFTNTALSQAEIDDLYDAVQKFNNSLGRAV